MKRLFEKLFVSTERRLSNVCFGQEGEDLILDRLMGGKARGFYVDIGAHHPIRFSNTHLFSKRGWYGINVDAEPGSMALFRKMRPRDVNIESGVGEKAGTMPFYRFDEPALNTFDAEEAALKNQPPYHITECVTVSVMRLDKILREHLPVACEIDFLSVDTEGMDLGVLKSNDWSCFRPRFVLAETLRTTIMQLTASPIGRLLLDVGYKPVAKTYNTAFFERMEM